MNYNISNKLKFLIVSLILLITILLVVPQTVNAAFSSNNNKFSSIIELVIKRTEEANQYKNFLNDISSFIRNIDRTMSIDDLKLIIIDKLSELQDRYSNINAIQTSAAQISNTIITSKDTTSTGLLQTLTQSISSLSLKTNSITQSLIPDVTVQNMVSTTAGKLSGEKYKVNLTGKIYYANVDRNGNPTSNKWVILVHGFLMNGQAIADSLGQMYLDQGYNVLAPDLRGFGDSDGNVAMGYLESLDIWDWITYLNETYSNKCDGIIVHGVSLGGATTVFLSGLEVDGIKLKDKNVIGLVEDCGYRSMTGIITDMLSVGNSGDLIGKLFGTSPINLDLSSSTDSLLKTLIINVIDVGLTNDNFNEKQNALNSLSKCELPLLIIHGTADSTVPVSNSTEIYNAAMQNPNIPYVQRFIADKENHAFIILGSQYNVYEGHVENFIKQAESIANGRAVNKVSDYNQKQPEKSSFLTTLIRALKLISNILNIN